MPSPANRCGPGVRADISVLELQALRDTNIIVVAVDKADEVEDAAQDD